MKAYWQQLQEKIDALNTRERIIVFAAVIVSVVLIFQVLLIDPLLAKGKAQKSQMRSLTSQINEQKNLLEQIDAQLAVGVNRHKKRQIQQLTEERASLDKEIESSIVAMIPPKLMPQVLENIIADKNKLQLVRLENKAVEALLKDETTDTNSGAAPAERAAQTSQDASQAEKGLYRHGFVLTLSGNFLAAIEYFEALNALPWKFRWEALRYEVDDYPRATITLEVYTVSMSEEWLGV